MLRNTAYSEVKLYKISQLRTNELLRNKTARQPTIYGTQCHKLDEPTPTPFEHYVICERSPNTRTLP